MPFQSNNWLPGDIVAEGVPDEGIIDVDGHLCIIVSRKSAATRFQIYALSPRDFVGPLTINVEDWYFVRPER